MLSSCWGFNWPKSFVGRSRPCYVRALLDVSAGWIGQQGCQSERLGDSEFDMSVGSNSADDFLWAESCNSVSPSPCRPPEESRALSGASFARALRKSWLLGCSAWLWLKMDKASNKKCSWYGSRPGIFAPPRFANQPGWWFERSEWVANPVTIWIASHGRRVADYHWGNVATRTHPHHGMR